MIKDLNFNLFDVLNKVHVDKFGQVSAFLALNKPVGITSHDLVDQVRRRLKTKNVGHAGALDPFASGVMLVLVGRKYTRLSNTLIELDKAYKASIVFGITTDTLDIEGKIIDQRATKEFDFETLKKAFKSFDGGYEQFVPIFSSVKVQGQKLRVLARSSKSFEFFAHEGRKHVRFFQHDGKSIELPLPFKKIEMSNTQYLNDGFLKTTDLKLNEEQNPGIIPTLPNELPFAEVEFDCSKGTYVRQFAYDLAQEIDQIAMLYALVRTKISNITLENCMDIEGVKI